MKWAKPQGTAQTGAVTVQYSGTRGGWKSSTSGLAHIHAAADDPDRSPHHRGRQREGQHGDQVCPQALAATSGQVRTWLQLHDVGLKSPRGRKGKSCSWKCSVGVPPYTHTLARTRVRTKADPGPASKNGAGAPSPSNQGSGKRGAKLPPQPTSKTFTEHSRPLLWVRTLLQLWG